MLMLVSVLLSAFVVGVDVWFGTHSHVGVDVGVGVGVAVWGLRLC